MILFHRPICTAVLASILSLLACACGHVQQTAHLASIDWHDPTHLSSTTTHELTNLEKNTHTHAPSRFYKVHTRLEGIQIKQYIEHFLETHPDVNIIHRGNIVRVVIQSDALFQPNSVHLKKTALPLLRDLTEFISIYHDYPVSITAYTDDIGTDHDNIELSSKQSKAVLGYLWAHGLSEKHMIEHGYGKHPTVATNDTVWGSKMNRRVELLFWASPGPPHV